MKKLVGVVPSYDFLVAVHIVHDEERGLAARYTVVRCLLLVGSVSELLPGCRWSASMGVSTLAPNLLCRLTSSLV